MVTPTRDWTDDRFDLFGGNSTRPQDARLAGAQVDDGAFDADVAVAAVQHQVDADGERLWAASARLAGLAL